MQGPPDCGKSALVAHALDQLEVIGKPATSVVRVDLRVNSFNNVAGFTATLSRLFAPVHRVRLWLHTLSVARWACASRFSHRAVVW